MSTGVGDELGMRFVRALADKDRDGLRACFAPDVIFRGLTPGEAWAASSPDEIAEVLFSGWFDDDDLVRETHELEIDSVSDRHRIHYRFLVDNAAGANLVEQHGYFDIEDGRIARMSLVCAGFRPLDGSVSASG